jgi:hypothetical protein
MNESRTEKILISSELYAKLEAHAKQKNITLDQEADELLSLGVQTVELFASVKGFMKGGDQEL